MKRLVYLGTFVALLVAGLSLGTFAGAQEDTISIPEPVPGGTTPVEGPPGGYATIPEPPPDDWITPVEPGGDTRLAGTIPTPQPSTPVEGPVTDPNDVTALPDTGGSVIAVACVAGVFLLASGLVVRRIIK